MEIKQPATLKPIELAAYDKVSTTYSPRGSRSSPEHARLIELAGVVPGARVLDLCCGPGLLTRLIKSTVGAEGEVVGVDLSEGMVTEARAQAEEEGLEMPPAAPAPCPETAFAA